MNNLTTRKIVLGTAGDARAGVQRAGHRRSVDANGNVSCSSVEANGIHI